MIDVPGREKILLYLIKKEKYQEKRFSSFFYCQEWIAESVELSQNRTSKLLVEMEENGLIEIESRKVKGASQKRYVYFLTEKGKKKAEKVKRDIEEENINIKTKDKVAEIELKDIDNYVQGSNLYLFTLNKINQDGVLDLTDIGEEDLFVNREKEIRMLKNFLKKKGNENLNTLLIEGCAGVGKTRLVEELRKYGKNEGFNFYEGKGVYESVESFFPFRRIFDEILEENPEILENENISQLFKNEDSNWEEGIEALDISIEDFFNKLKNSLESFSSERPTIIFVDNLQWADSVSVQFFEYITDELEENSVDILGAYRKEDTKNPNSGRSIYDIIHSNNSKIVGVDPFDWRNTRKLLMRRIGRNNIPGKFVEMIYNLTEGIPLFINAITDEMLNEGVLQPLKDNYPETLGEIKLPKKVNELYDIKFKKLNKKEREVLQLCSCIDDDFSEDLVISTAQGENNEIEEIIGNLKKANFLKDHSENRLDFTYEITRFTIYKNLSRSRRKKLHRNIAQSLKKIDEGKVVNYHLRLGKHLEKIGKFKEAVESYLKGANETEEIYENDRAIELYERALKILEKHPVQMIDENKIHEDLAGVLEKKEDHRKALNHLKKAENKTEGERRQLCLNRKIAGCLRETSQYEKALEYIEKGEGILSKMDQMSFDNKKEKCKLLKEKGMIYLRKNEFEDCQNIFEKMRELSDKIGSKKDKGEAIHYLGTISYYRSDFDRAKEYLQRSIELREKADDLEGLTKSYNNLGVVFRNLQEPHKALEFYKKTNKIKKELGSREGDISALENIGTIYFDLGELDKSIEYYQECLEIEKKIKDHHGMAATLDNIGVVYFGKGEFDKALQYHERSLEMKKRLENRSGISFSLYNMGLSYRGKGELEKALELLKESLEIRKELEDKLNIGYSKLWIGIVHLDLGNLGKSNEYLKDALDIFKTTKSDHGMGMALTFLGRLKVLQSSMDEAKKYLEHSEKIKSKLEEEGYKLMVDRHLAEFYLKKNRLEKSIAHCQGSLRRAKRSGMMNELGKCRKVLGNIYWEKGILRRGKEEFKKAVNIFDETGDKKNKAEVMLEWGNKLIERGEEDKGEKKRSDGLKLLEECQIDLSS
ncbi:MAG: tetratricopeptide repeat protein [Candidatus Thermoplasmatota archaeon]|nr:tetratricopeptide repeat protein [Candidatus Thermoplasmatota archaeon]